MKLRATNVGANVWHATCEEKPKLRINSFCMSLVMRRKYLIAWAWLFSVLLGVWLLNSCQTVENCSRSNKITQPAASNKVQFVRVKGLYLFLPQLHQIWCNTLKQSISISFFEINKQMIQLLR